MSQAAQVIEPTPDPIEVCMDCGKESEVVAHGLKNGELYDEPRCFDCYNKARRGQ